MATNNQGQATKALIASLILQDFKKLKQKNLNMMVNME